MLLVFADDWGRHPSSSQHLVRHLLPTHATTWVNTIGTRTPRLDMDTIRRAAGKARQWFGKKQAGQREPLPTNLRVTNPKMWPWLTRKFDRRLNRALLTKQLAPLVTPDTVAITALPIVADLMATLPVARWVYYCVDDFSQWPGLDRETMGRLERIVVERADRVIAVSDNLRDRLATMGRQAELLTHGVDVEAWQTPTPTTFAFDHLPKPWIVFWGVVDPRMDATFVTALAKSLREGTIILAGPEQNPDPAMLRYANVQRVGALPFATLPALAEQASVLVMPYVDQPVTRAIQPLKLKEYLATGKPTVARDLPANRDWADALDLVATPEAFVAAVQERLQTGLPATQAHARQRLNQESWAAKAQLLARYAGL